MGMKKRSLVSIVRYCDRTLGPEKFSDWAGAVNGLQVENRGTVSRIAAAVDGSLATIKKAVEAKADLLLVHHGLFWGGESSLDGEAVPDVAVAAGP